jgi:transposase InsO family protein
MFDWWRSKQGVASEKEGSPELPDSRSESEPVEPGPCWPTVDAGTTDSVPDAAAPVAGAQQVDRPTDTQRGGERQQEQGAGSVDRRGDGSVVAPSDGWDAVGVADAVECSGAVGAGEDVEPEESPAAPSRGRGSLAVWRRGRRLVKPEEVERPPLTGEQRLWILDTWKRSGLPAGDFAPLVGLSKHTLYSWKKQFAEHGPAGLMEHKRGMRQGSRLPELTKRTILLLKQAHPEWGCERISAMLLRGPALPASASAVARVLHEAGYQLEEVTTRPHADQVRHFERAKPNELWQTDLFTFMLKRQNRRLYLVAFLDDHSRFIVSYGLHASQSTALVLEVLRAAIASYAVPQEILTDNGAQYVTWRGTSQFSKELQKQGIRQLVAAPRRPQTLGKIERFWGTLWRECIETAIFVDLADAQTRIGHFIDYYNFQRTHSGIGGLVPADRFFGAAPDVLRTLKERVASNACELARQGVPKPPFYMTGQVGGQSFSVHAEGERVILRRDGGARQEVELVAPETAGAGGDAQAARATADAASAPAESPQPLCPRGAPLASLPDEAEESVSAPGVSPLHEAMEKLPQVRQATEMGSNDAHSGRKGGEA